jgi:hypothetical protein
MSKITNNEAFRQALSSISLEKQRQIGARFVRDVLDLTDNPLVKNGQAIAAKSGVTAEELNNAYHGVHTAYVATHPSSDLSALDYAKQAEHFVAEACMACLSPTFHETGTHHLAAKVAMYCQMARTCSTINHEGEYPEFSGVEEAVKKLVDSQYQILSEYLKGG